MEIDYTQLSFVLLWIILLESLMHCSPLVSRWIQRLVGGRQFLRVMKIAEEKKSLQDEKNKYYSVDDFPKRAKLDRRMIKLELEEESIPLSKYVRYGIPILLPIALRTLSYTTYLLLVILYRNLPILTYRQPTWLPYFLAIAIGFPTGVEGGLGCVYVIFAVKKCYYYLLQRATESCR